MTPKEKAKDLMNRFSDWTYDERHSNKSNIHYTKQCALICVDEILNTYLSDDKENYWQEVKKEIEKL